MLVLAHLLLVGSATLGAQNINGEKVIVGKESITVINFPDKVLNINFSDDGAYEYYIPKRREEKSISLQFNKEKQEAPNTNLLVNEGGRSHMFHVLFDSTYNINDDTRPPLWYDHSNLKELKTFVQKQKDRIENPVDEAKEKEELAAQQKKEAELRKAEYDKAQALREKELEQNAKLAEQQRLKDEAAQKEQAAALVKAKQEAQEKEKQLQLAAAKEEQEKKAAELKARKEAEELAKQKAEADKKLKALQDKQAAEAAAKEKELKALQAKKDAEALEKARQEKELQDKKAAEALAQAKKDAEEKKRLQDEKLAKQKAEEAEKRRIAAEALAKKEAERKAARERLEKLEAARKEQEANKAYSEAGLWQRYGKRGINVYDVPANHMGTVISDFYIAKDTLLHYQVSSSLLNTNDGDNLSVDAVAPVNKGVKITLEKIFFKDVYCYYKLKVDNNTDDDFLMGRTYMYWYDANEKPIKMIKSSYITYVTRFPLVKPHTKQEVIFATRSPNVGNGESLVLFIDERRKEMGGTSIVISSDVYNQELKKFQQDVPQSSQKNGTVPTKKDKKKTTKR